MDKFPAYLYSVAAFNAITAIVVDNFWTIPLALISCLALYIALRTS